MTGTAQPDDCAWLDTLTTSCLVLIFALCQRPVSPCHRRKETETPEAQGKKPRPQMDSGRMSHHGFLIWNHEQKLAVGELCNIRRWHEQLHPYVAAEEKSTKVTLARVWFLKRTSVKNLIVALYLYRSSRNMRR
jgi:hypothetical protein